MEIQLDLRKGMPIYAQIVDRIKHMVATGRLKPGQQLPPIRQLASELHIDPNTVARAYSLLDAEGVISTQQGRGTFVAEHPNRTYLVHMRKERLQGILEEALLEALSLGYSCEELEEAFRECLARWRHLEDKADVSKAP